VGILFLFYRALARDEQPKAANTRLGVSVS